MLREVPVDAVPNPEPRTASPAAPSAAGAAHIERRPARSPAAWLLAPTLRSATWLVRHTDGRASAGVPKLAFLSDHSLGLMQPAVPGTTRTPVRVPGHAGRIPAELVEARAAAESENVVLYFHGGAFFSCGIRSHRRLVSRISAAAGVPVLNVGYRQLPQASLAESVRDCLDAYRFLLDRGYRGDQVVLAGDSAGGYLAFAVALRAAAEGLPAPAGIATMAPWLDLECRYSLAHPNARSDPYLPLRRVARIIPLLFGGNPPSDSVLAADPAALTALPPTFVQVSSVEALLSDAELVTARLADARVPVRLQIWERQVHVFQALADFVPEAAAAITEFGDFIADALAPATGQEEAA